MKNVDITRHNLEKSCKGWLQTKEKIRNKKYIEMGIMKNKHCRAYFKAEFREKYLRECVRKATGEFMLFCLGYNIE